MEKKVKNNRKAPIIDINKKMDIAYVGICPTTTSTIGIDLNEDIVAHYDVKKKEVIGFTIIHWDQYRQKLYLKEKAKESVKAINDYILKHCPTIPLPTSILFSQKAFL